MTTEAEKRIDKARELRDRARQLDSFRIDAEQSGVMTAKSTQSWWLRRWLSAPAEREVPKKVVREFVTWSFDRVLELNAEADALLASVEARDA